MNCDPIARWYRYFEYLAFGRALQRRRLEFLDDVADARNVLILGDGDGRFTAEFVNRNPQAIVDSVDSSERMLQLAQRRVRNPNVRFRLGDARTIPLSGKYDLIVTHFFLDCFTDSDLNALLPRISGHCEPDARWVVSEFGLPISGVAQVFAKMLIRLMYFFFRLMTGLTVTQLPNYSAAFARHGFRVVREHTLLRGLLVSQIWKQQ